MPRLEDWAVVFDGDGYTPPELLRIELQGAVYDHPNPRHHDGKRVSTSYVVAADGRQVTTYSGSVYTLGAPTEHYAKWCADQGKPIDPDNPIKVHSGNG